MTDAEILDNSVIFFMAGNENPSACLAFATHLLVHHPDVQERARQEVLDLIALKGELDYNSLKELHYVDQVLNETMRLYPPIYLFVNREAGEDVDLGPLWLPKGTAVQVPLHALHRDPDVWEEPEAFRPDRNKSL